MRYSPGANLSPRSLNDVTIILDTGHDHKDSGATANGVVEVEFTRKQTAAIKKELESRGYKVILCSGLNADADGDKVVSNAERAKFANQYPNSLMLSIHADAGSRNGTTIYYPTEVDSTVNSNSSFWAHGIANALGVDALTEKSTDKGANGGLEKSRNLDEGSAILTVEVLNLNNKQDAEKAKSQRFIDDYARKFVNALEDVGNGAEKLPKGFRQQGQQEVAGVPNAQQQQSTQPQQLQQGINLSLLSSIGAGDRSSFLKLGSSGPAVVELKKLINTWRKSNGKSELPLTSDFDAELDRAIRDFQKASGISKELKLFSKGGLKVDGVVGPWTLTALMKANGFEDPQAALSSASGSSIDLMAALHSIKGGVFVDSITGEPDWDEMVDLQYGEFRVPVSVRQFSEAEVTGPVPPKEVIDALNATYAAYEDYCYIWGGDGIGEHGMDCSAFVSHFLKRLGLKSKSGGWLFRTVDLIDADQVFPGQVTEVHDKNQLRAGDFIVWRGEGKGSHTGVVAPDGQTIMESAGRFDGVGNKTSVDAFIKMAGGKRMRFFRPTAAGVFDIPPQASAGNVDTSQISSIAGLTPEEIESVAKEVEKREVGKEGLADWASTENFASLGRMHATWGSQSVIQHGNSFIGFLQYAESKGATLPDFLKQNKENPWTSRQAFMAAKRGNDPRMVALIKFLDETRGIQAEYLVNRASQAFSNLGASLPESARSKLTALLSTAKGMRAAIDYVNFKGEGSINSSSSWGFANVIAAMSSEGDPVKSFSVAAREILASRHPKYQTYKENFDSRTASYAR